jgi:hypothetical protein
MNAFPTTIHITISLAIIIGCPTLLVSDHGSFGIYVYGHMVNGKDLAYFLGQE